MSTKDTVLNVGLLAAGGVAIAAASGVYGKGSRSRVSIGAQDSQSHPLHVDELLQASFAEILKHAQRSRFTETYAVESFEAMPRKGSSIEFRARSNGLPVSVSFLIDGNYVNMRVGKPGAMSRQDRSLSFPLSTPVGSAADYLNDLLRAYGASR
jgi:hypothetical protein